MSEEIRIVVADDSPFVCRLLTSHLQSSPDIRVVGTALDGPRALELTRELRPDAVTLDLGMPGMTGLEVLEQLMRDCPIPVILISGVSRQAADLALEALQRGAVDFIFKYTPGVDTDAEALRREIIAKVRTAAQVRVLPSHNGSRVSGGPQSLPEAAGVETQSAPADPWTFGTEQVIVVGASNGGPVALRELLENLPVDFPAGFVVVQHLPASFTRVLAAQLDKRVALRIKEAEDGDRLQPGLVLIAPGDRHLLVRATGRVELRRAAKVRGHRPSIDVAMESAAQAFGAQARGVVLTGMGTDGLIGLASIRRRGGKTFAQDAASCVASEMPQRALEKGVASHVGSPRQIAEWLLEEHAAAEVTLGVAQVLSDGAEQIVSPGLTYGEPSPC
jgi:two-component system chemotaxis response regulator CheB